MNNNDFISKEEAAESFVMVEEAEYATAIQHETRFCSTCRELYWKTYPHCYCDTRS